jgi:hypothetical protein
MAYHGHEPECTCDEDRKREEDKVQARIEELEISTSCHPTISTGCFPAR